MEKIVSEISQKLKKCPQCGRPHKIAHINRIPSDTKLAQYPCHLRFHPDHYIGSFEDQGFTIDVYSYPIRWKRIYVELGEKLKEPSKKKTLAEEYLEFQDEDEDSLED